MPYAIDVGAFIGRPVVSCKRSRISQVPGSDTSPPVRLLLSEQTPRHENAHPLKAPL